MEQLKKNRTMAVLLGLLLVMSLICNAFLGLCVYNLDKELEEEYARYYEVYSDYLMLLSGKEDHEPYVSDKEAGKTTENITADNKTTNDKSQLLVEPLKQSDRSDYIGESLYTGLYLLDNGEYQTQDGRFTAKVGEAVIISDGEMEKYNSKFEVHDRGLMITVENKYGFEIQHFYKSASEDWTTGIYDAEEFTYNRVSSDGGINTEYGGTPYNPLAPFLQYHTQHERYVHALPGLTGEITGLTLRVMYADDNTAVFYSCATYKTAPHTVETFAVVSLDFELSQKEEEQSSSSWSSILDSQSKKRDCWRCGGSGKRDCTMCDGKGYKEYYYNGPNYSGSYINRNTVKDCTTCNKTGRVDCTTCGGDGEI